MKNHIKLLEEFIKTKDVLKIRWDEANKLIPISSTFNVIDARSGESWKMERTSGKYHADVEPLTKEDTDKMLSCFPDDRSFEEATYRPVIIEIGSKKYAAALMGFPHAGSNFTSFGEKTKKLSGGFKNMKNWDHIRNNQTIGHFCLHFLGSLRHTDQKKDAKAQKAISEI